MSEALSRLCEDGHGMKESARFCILCGKSPQQAAGRYKVRYEDHPLPVTETHLRDSKEVGKLSKNDIVEVLEFWKEPVDDSLRVRAYIASPQGWITTSVATNNGRYHFVLEAPPIDPSQNPVVEAPRFELSEAVEVYSTTQQQWVGAVVAEMLPDGGVHVRYGTSQKKLPRELCNSSSIRKAQAVAGRTSFSSEAEAPISELNKNVTVLEARLVKQTLASKETDIKAMLEDTEIRKKAKEILLEGGDVYPKSGEDAIIFCTGKATKDSAEASKWERLVAEVQANIKEGPELEEKLAQQTKDRAYEACAQTQNEINMNKSAYLKLLDEIVILDSRCEKTPPVEKRSMSVLEEMKTVLMKCELARDAALKDKTDRQAICLLSNLGCSKAAWNGQPNEYCTRNHQAMAQFKVGDCVDAKYKGGQFHSARIVSVDAAKDIITVNWDDRNKIDDREKHHTSGNVEVKPKADLEP